MLTDIKTRELSLGELFRFSIELYQKYFKWIIVISLGVFLPYHIILMFIPSLDMTTLNRAVMMQDPDSMQVVLFTVYSSMAVNLVFTPLAIAGITALAGDASEGRVLSFSSILDASLVKWGKHVLTAFLYMFFVIVGSFLIIPGVYYAVAYTFYPNSVAISDKWGLSALRESAARVKGRWLSTFGIIILLSVLSSIVSVIWTGVLTLTVGEVGSLVIALAGVIVETFCLYFQVVITLLYLNRHYLNTEEYPNSENFT